MSEEENLNNEIMNLRHKNWRLSNQLRYLPCLEDFSNVDEDYMGDIDDYLDEYQYEICTMYFDDEYQSRLLGDGNPRAETGILIDVIKLLVEKLRNLNI